MAASQGAVGPKSNPADVKTPDPVAPQVISGRPEVECIVCHEEIKHGAKKCVHCDSFQDWRRFFGDSSTVLALLIALISVITTGSPVLKTILTPNSDIRLSVFETNISVVKIIVSNLGNRSAVFRSANLVVTHGLQSSKPIFLKLTGKLDTDPILEPGKSKILELSAWVAGAGAPLPRQERIETNCAWKISLDIVAFDHVPKNNTLTIKCPI